MRHALAAGKIENTLTGIEQGAKSLAEEGDVDTLVDWLHRLPAESGRSRINLQLTLIWGMTHLMQLTEVKQLIEDLDQALAQNKQLLDREKWLEFQVIKAIYYAFVDDSITCKSLCEPLLAKLPLRSTWVTGLLCNVAGWCYFIESRHDKAEEVQRYAPLNERPEKNLFATVFRNTNLGGGHIRQAKLDRALSFLTDALELTEAHTERTWAGAVNLAALLAEIYYERNQWNELDILLTQRLPSIDKLVNSDGLLSCYRAIIREALFYQQPQRAQQLIEHGLQRARQSQWHRLYAGMLHEQLRFSLIQGEHEQALTALEQLEASWQRLHTTTPSTYSKVNEYLIQGRARILISDNQYAEASALLTPLLTTQEQLGNRLLGIQLRVLLALCQYYQGDQIVALLTLQPALIIAEQQGIVRSFLDEGDAMKQLLGKARQHADIALPQSYIDQLLSLPVDTSNAKQSGEERAAELQNPSLDLLTARERETLKLAADGQSNKKIALTLEISAETVKWHLKNIYTKLHVPGRIPAIARAQELGLLG